MTKTKLLNKTEFCKLMIWFQDNGNIRCNQFATRALEEFGVSQRLHQKLTKKEKKF